MSFATLLGSPLNSCHAFGDASMLNKENQVDKDRFEKLKDTQVERGRDEETAMDVAADEVKEMRRREGRSKEDDKARQV
jgi:hypothetical protein